MRHVKIILLDGTSSSGKTTLAAQLLDQIRDRALFWLSVDEFLHCFSNEFVKRICSGKEMNVLHDTVAKFHRTIAFASTLHDMVVVDHVLQFPQWRNQLLDLVDRDSLLYVQVYCPLELLEAREKARGNRHPGLARGQFEPVYSFTDFDLRIDTSKLSPEESARTIISHLSYLEETP